MRKYLFSTIVAIFALHGVALATMTEIQLSIFSPAPAFYVATTGSDTNAGTLAAPFLTLEKAQSAMEASSTKKTVYIRAGNYTLSSHANCDFEGGTCGIDIGGPGNDNGTTWSYYPPDGYDSASFTAGSTSASTGLSYGFYSNGTSNVTINGLAIHNFKYAGIGAVDGSNNLTLENNLIYNGYDITDAAAGGIMCFGCTGMVVSHNVIHDIAYFGVAVSSANGDLSNLNWNGNVVYNTCTGVADCGGLYIIDVTGANTNMQVFNNYVHDSNTAAADDGGYGAGLYADDCTSNVTFSGNVVTGRNGSNNIMTHGGSNVHVIGNLIDLTTHPNSFAVYQTSGQPACAAQTMNGNTFEHNLSIVGNLGGGGFYLLSGSPVNAPTIMDNAYWAYGPTQAYTDGDGGIYDDANPTFEDPSLTCWSYLIGSGSPVFGSPVSFVDLVRGWGPPGYTIPQTGTVPSSPHTC